MITWPPPPPMKRWCLTLDRRSKTIHRRNINVWQYADGAFIMTARQATIYDADAKHYLGCCRSMPIF